VASLDPGGPHLVGTCQIEIRPADGIGERHRQRDSRPVSALPGGRYRSQAGARGRYRRDEVAATTTCRSAPARREEGAPAAGGKASRATRAATRISRRPPVPWPAGPAPGRLCEGFRRGRSQAPGALPRGRQAIHAPRREAARPGASAAPAPRKRWSMWPRSPGRPA
jgi:hypothetical protein